jgi:thymidylate synthase
METINMNNTKIGYEEQYLKLLSDIKMNGVLSKNRTGIDTYKIWGAQLHINLQEGFPILTTKKMYWKSIVHELLWMISGDTNIQYLLKNGVTFWTEWPYQKYVDWYNKLRCDTVDFTQNWSGPEPEQYTQKEFEQEIINNAEFAKSWGSIGECGYGGLWRNFPYAKYWELPSGVSYDGARTGHKLAKVDQLVNAINELKTNPDSRRIIISAWHPYHSNRKEDALLPACHNYIQFGTEELSFGERLDLYYKTNISNKTISPSDEELSIIPKYRLNCYYSMRSNDFFLGNPYNNSFYALLTHLVANHLNMIPNKLVFSGADVHLYKNHREQCDLQLTREPRPLPRLNIKSPGKSIFDMTYDDIELVDYNPHPAIKAEVAV